MFLRITLLMYIVYTRVTAHTVFLNTRVSLVATIPYLQGDILDTSGLTWVGIGSSTSPAAAKLAFLEFLESQGAVTWFPSFLTVMENY